MKAITTILAIVIAIVGVGWLGLQGQASPFIPYTAQTPAIDTLPLPKGLPAPVERFYKTVYGERVPVFTTVVMSGRASLRPYGPFYLPARFRFTHVAGRDYRHYIEATFFDIPFMKVNESYVDGRARMELPFGTDEGPNLNQAAVGAVIGTLISTLIGTLTLTGPHPLVCSERCRGSREPAEAPRGDKALGVEIGRP